MLAGLAHHAAATCDAELSVSGDIQERGRRLFDVQERIFGAYKGQRPEKLEESLKNLDFRTKFMMLVYMYEAKVNNPSEAKLFKLANLPFDVDPERVTAYRECSTETEMMYGIFWPITVYKAREGSMPPKHLIEQMEHCGKKIQGHHERLHPRDSARHHQGAVKGQSRFQALARVREQPDINARH